VYNCCVVYIVVRVAWCVWRDECHGRRLTAEGFDGKPNDLCTMLYDILEQHHAISIGRGLPDQSWHHRVDQDYAKCRVPWWKVISRDACLGKQPSRIWCVSVCEMKALLAGFFYVLVWNVCMRYHSRAPGAPVSKDFWSSVCHERLFLQSEELERCMVSPRIFLYNYRNMKSWQLCHSCYWPNLKVCSFS
jgi:hypothetical protein